MEVSAKSQTLRASCFIFFLVNKWNKLISLRVWCSCTLFETHTFTNISLECLKLAENFFVFVCLSEGSGDRLPVPQTGTWMHLEKVEKNGGGGMKKKNRKLVRAAREAWLYRRAGVWQGTRSGRTSRDVCDEGKRSDWIAHEYLGSSPRVCRGAAVKIEDEAAAGDAASVFFTCSAKYTYILFFLSFTTPVIHLCFRVCPKPNSSASSTQSTTRPSHAITESPLFIFERPCSSPSRSPSPPPSALFTRRRSQTSH